ncbi:MAG: PH domain-containing protein [archaeon]|nr:PH domain-containing protein [archaeon]
MSGQEYSTLVPRCKTVQRVKYLVVDLILLALVWVSWTFRIPGLDEWPAIVLCIPLLAMVAVTLVFPGIYHRHYRYMVTSDKVDVRRGVIFLRHTVVPIERIHQVNVTGGPFSRMFGLARVEVTTAGGTAHLEYLERDVADGIAEELNRTVDAILRARKHA